MRNLLLTYLTWNRENFFPHFCYFLNKIKLENKNKIKLLILCNIDNNIEYFRNTLNSKLTDIEFEIVSFEPIHKNYYNKIEYLINYAEQHNFEYCMKIDNDILVNNNVLDYLFENMNILDDEQNIVLSPELSSGIPTTDKFINNFLNDSEKEHLYKLFLKTNFGGIIWGFDYESLNDCTLRTTTWDSNNYYERLKNLPYHFKGIHPVRIDAESIKYLNSVILSKKDLFYKNLEMNMYEDKSAYFCNSIFIIKTKKYKEYFNDNSLWVDVFDEVPLNKYIEKNNLKKIFVNNTFCIHPYYNYIPDYYSLERNFFMNFYSDLQI